MNYKIKVQVIFSIGLIISTYPFNIGAQPKSTVITLLRQSMKECRSANTLRRTDLQSAQEKYQAYESILKQALEIDPTITQTKDPTVERILTFCQTVKSDLNRAQALLLFERGLSQCEEGRISLSNGAFNDAREKQASYTLFKKKATNLSASFMDIYQNSYQFKLCEQLTGDISAAESDYKRQLKRRAKNQKNLNQVFSSYNDAVSQCRGAQKILNDKTRYNTKTIQHVGMLISESKLSKSTAENHYNSFLKSKAVLSKNDKTKIDRLSKTYKSCETVIPELLTRAKRMTVNLAKNKNADPNKKGPNNTKQYKQIVGAQAQYPDKALERNIQGHVIVRFTVAKSGNTKDIQIIESEPKGVFDQSVITAVQKYMFQPGIRSGIAMDTPGVERKIVFTFDE